MTDSGEQSWQIPKPSNRNPRQRSAPSKSSDFDSLLKKEFKPKTDEAKEAVERAVRTLAEQALSQTKLISTRRRQVDRGDHRRSSTRS